MGQYKTHKRIPFNSDRKKQTMSLKTQSGKLGIKMVKKAD